jgi:hypothetical protein
MDSACDITETSESEMLATSSTVSPPGTEYRVFRKIFHLPSQWKALQPIVDLTEHRYAVINAEDTFRYIENRFRQLGYMEDNNAMVHDYLHFILIDMLVEAGETFLTEKDIRDNEQIKKFLNNSTPDLIVKTSSTRIKPLIIDIYVGSKDTSSIKAKYRSLDYMANFHIITPYNFTTELKDVFSDEKLSYLHQHFQLFQTEYQYWRSCMKLKKILLNEVENVKIKEFDLHDVDEVARTSFLYSLTIYACNVSERKGL